MTALLLLTGCHRHFFHATGEVSSTGSTFGTWSSPPQGCTRDPDDARRDAETRTVATFLWEDPADYDGSRRDHHMPHVPDAPAQFELLHAPAGGSSAYDVRLKTVFTTGTLIHPADCTTFQVETHEEPPGYPAGRPALGGTVRLECQIRESRVFADFTFSRCDY